MSRDTNFYYSFLVLPPVKRRAIVSVWDFCRAVDDAADEPGPDDRESIAKAVARWRDELDRCYGSSPPLTEQGRGLQPVVRRFELPREPFDDLVRGVEMDVGYRRYATFDELRTYCYRVASTVGLICVEIFGYRNPETRRYAVQLGMALQLTNILRDVASDLARGRLYLPLEDLARFGCSEADLAQGLRHERVAPLLAHQAARARSFYASAAEALPAEDARRMVAAEIMGAIYFEILKRIERRGYDIFSERIRIPRPRRAVIAARTWIGTLLLGAKAGPAPGRRPARP